MSHLDGRRCGAPTVTMLNVERLRALVVDSEGTFNRCYALQSLLENRLSLLDTKERKQLRPEEYKQVRLSLQSLWETVHNDRVVLYQTLALIINGTSLQRPTSSMVCARCEANNAATGVPLVEFQNANSFTHHIFSELKNDLADELCLRFKPDSPFNVPSKTDALTYIRQHLSYVTCLPNEDSSKLEGTVISLWLSCIEANLYHIFVEFSSLLNHPFQLTENQLEHEFCVFVSASPTLVSTAAETQDAVASISLQPEFQAPTASATFNEEEEEEERKTTSSESSASSTSSSPRSSRSESPPCQVKIDSDEPLDLSGGPRVEVQQKAKTVTTTTSTRKANLNEQAASFKSTKRKRVQEKLLGVGKKTTDFLRIDEKTFESLVSTGFISRDEQSRKLVVPQAVFIAKKNEFQLYRKRVDNNKKQEEEKDEEDRDDLVSLASNDRSKRPTRPNLDIVADTIKRSKETNMSDTQLRSHFVETYIGLLRQENNVPGKLKVLKNIPQELESLAEAFNIISQFLHLEMYSENESKLFIPLEKLSYTWQKCVEQKAKEYITYSDILAAIASLPMSKEFLLKVSILAQTYMSLFCVELLKMIRSLARPPVVKAETIFDYVFLYRTEGIGRSIDADYEALDARKCFPTPTELRLSLYQRLSLQIFRKTMQTDVRQADPFWSCLENILNSEHCNLYGLSERTLCEPKALSFLKTIWFRLVHDLVQQTTVSMNGSGWTWNRVVTCVTQNKFQCDFPNILKSALTEMQDLSSENGKESFN